MGSCIRPKEEHTLVPSSNWTNVIVTITIVITITTLIIVVVISQPVATPPVLIKQANARSSLRGMDAAGIDWYIIKAKLQQQTSEISRILSRPGSLQSPMLNYKKTVNWTLLKGEWEKTKIEGLSSYICTRFVLVPVEGLCCKPKYPANIIHRSILFPFLFPFLIYLSLTLPAARIQFTVLSDMLL